MSLDLGEFGDLAVALGLVDSDGLVGDWFVRPGDHLGRVLSNDAQRAAVLRLAETLLDAAPQPAGALRWLPLLKIDTDGTGGTFTAAVVIDESAPDTVRIGAGLRLRLTTTSGVGLDADVHVPIYATSRGDAGLPEPVLLGTPAGVLDIDLSMRLPPGGAPGAVALDAVRLGAEVPTGAGAEPRFRLALLGLQLPGAAAPRDVIVDAAAVDELDDAVLELVLGLVRALVADLPATDPLRGLAALLGLTDNAVPDFPIAELLAVGPAALADWLARALGGETTRAAWLEGLARLLEGSVADDTVTVTLGAAQLELGIGVAPGVAGRPRVSPRVRLVVAGADGVSLVLEADPVTVDLGTGAVVALPRLSATARLKASVGSLLGPVVEPASGLSVHVGSLHAGLALDGNRRPVLVLQAHDADIGATHFDVLDLSSAQALAGAAQQVVTDAAEALMVALGPIGSVVGVLIGLADPPGARTPVPRVDAAALLADPVAAVARRWLEVLDTAFERVPDLLAVLRDAVAAADVVGNPVDGVGSEQEPWRVPLASGLDLLVRHAGPVLTVSLQAEVGGADLAGSGLSVEFAANADLVELDLRVRRATFLPAAGGRLVFTGPAGAPLTLGSGPVGVGVSALGMSAGWLATGGFRVAPLVRDPRLRLPGGELALPELTVDGTGRLILDDAGWEAIEQLAGAAALAAAEATGTGWPVDVARLLGWLDGMPGAGAHLALAELVADPAAALTSFAGTLVGVAAGTALVDLMGSLLAGPGMGRSGVGSPELPWAVPLGAHPSGADAAPALLAALAPGGPERAATAVTGPLRGWQPGDAGLPPDVLVDALVRDASIDPELADLVRGRGDIVTGLGEVIDRWVGTDGLVTMPADPAEAGVPAGVAVHRIAELAHAASLDALPLTNLLGAAPATVVYVAVDTAGAPDVLPDAPADQIIDLAGPGRPPESFAVPAAGLGTWVLRLGTRGDCRDTGLPGGDADGIDGQAARLRRVLAGLAGVPGGVVVVAHGGAGHAAVRAAAGIAGIAAVVTVGTPWSPVSVDVLDRYPAADALRLLGALLPGTDPDEPDDDDLALARALIGALLALDPLSDPIAELRPPAALMVPAGVAVHAVVGVVSAEAVRRALTAVFAAALSDRARLRAEAVAPEPELTRTGIRLPLLAPVVRGGLLLGVVLDVDLWSVAGDGDRPPTSDPRLTVRVELGAPTGWLIGGPDPGRLPGVPRPLALRRLTATVGLPLPGSTLPGSAHLVLHDARALGLPGRNRLVVADGPDALAGAVPLLPEVRALLGEVAARVTAAAGDPAGRAVRDALAALGLIGPDGGLDAVSTELLLLDPVGAVAAASARRTALAAALRDLTGDTRADAADTVRAVLLPGPGPAAHATLDLAAGSVRLTASGRAAVPWEIDVGTGSGGPTGSLRLGPDLAALGDGTGVALLLDTTGPTIVVRIRRPGHTDNLPLWPAPDPIALGRALAEVVPAVLLHVLLDALRGALPERAAAAVDTVLDALGILGAPVTSAVTGDPVRPTRLPAALVADPVGWLRSLPTAAGSSGLATLAPTLLDALRGVLSAGGGAGRLAVATGVELTSDVRNGVVVLGVAIDGSAFAAAGGPRLMVGGSAGLAVVTGQAGVSALPSVQLALSAAGVGAVRLGVQATPGGAPAIALALVPAGGVEIALLPAGPGLGGAASAAGAVAVRALPPLLDALAARDPAAGVPTDVLGLAGRAVARIGDAFGLRVAAVAGRQFDAAALASFAADPAAALAARIPVLAAGALDLLADAAGPLLGPAADRTVTVVDGALVLGVGPVELRWCPGIGRVELRVDAGAVRGVRRVELDVAVDPTGLLALDVMIGPAELTAGPVTLRPFARVRAGAAPPGGPLVEVGLGVGEERRLAARWAQGGFALVAVRTRPGDPTESTAPGDVAAAAAGAVLDVAGAVVLALNPVRTALVESPVLGTTAQQLLTGVLLTADAVPRLLPDLLDAAALPARLAALLDHLATAPGAQVAAGPLRIGATRRVDGTRTHFGLAVTLDGPFQLVVDGPVVVHLEADAAWINPPVTPGLALEILTVEDTGTVPTVGFAAGLTVGGLGVRIARSGGPLIDAAITVDTVAVQVFAALGDGSLAGGTRIELSGLAVPLAGASGGDNPVAQGLLASGGTAGDPPAPRFSPSLAVQKHPGGPVTVTLSAGPGSGPWWLVVQRALGPVFVEQIGFQVTVAQDHLGSIGLLLDGRVSLLGLTAAVDDLSLTYLVSSGSPLSPDAWRVDLAGFAITADMAGLTLTGGLRRFPSTAGGVEYLGLLLARLGVYGIGVYGGYGLVGPEHDQFAALFLFGAVNGPIGGPPAFFITGIGGGFGINRALRYPENPSRFGDFPFIKALDPAARPGDPMAELEAVRDFFPAERGTFWFAAGLSFTSFALVDGIAVVALQIGNGFEIALLGLARMTLPRPQVPLVSIELGLLARFSTRDGALIVQAQLTDNSWLLHSDVKLTGGFAFATWFSGPNRGQAVVSLGGYHPSFRRTGYPQVPRLGLSWKFGDHISITGESYFALTSEAVMAGARIDARARFGPAWAHLVVGGDGIVFFDPFWFEVTVYAEISAGVTIDFWLGEVTFEVSLSAEVTLSGPPFHGRARFGVGPVTLTVEFGDQPTEPVELPWDQFVVKYLEEAAPGVAHVLAALPGRGAQPPAGSATSGGARSPDGSAAHPFRVVAEFELTVTSTVPVRQLAIGNGAAAVQPTSRVVAVAPMRAGADPLVRLRFTSVRPAVGDQFGRFTVRPERLGAFAVGTWGQPQNRDNPKVPSGDVLAAVDRIVLLAAATIANPTSGTAPSIRYRQVETGDRRVLPFVVESTEAARAALRAGSASLAGLVPAGNPLTVAAGLLASRARRGRADVRAWTGERAAAPLLGSLGEGLGGTPRPVTVGSTAPPPVTPAAAPGPPTVRAMLAAAAADPPPDPGSGVPARSSTTVSPRLLDPERRTVRQPPPSLADVDARLADAVPARLLRVSPAAAAWTGGAPAAATLVATGAPPVTRTGRTGVAAVAGRGSDPLTADRLRRLGESLTGARIGLSDNDEGGVSLAAGELLVLDRPGHERDVDAGRRPSLTVTSGGVRVVALLPGSTVAVDVVVAKGGAAVDIPAGVATVAVLAGPPADGALRGWLADVPAGYVGDETLLAAGCVIRSAGRIPRRGSRPVPAGWVTLDELVGGDSAVLTTFPAQLDAVAVAFEGGTDGLADLELGVDGIDRAAGPDGRPAPPVLVADGPRAVAVFALAPRTDRARPVTVTVVTSAARRLTGVAGAQAARRATASDPTLVDRLAAALAGRGPGLVAAAPVADGLGAATFIWKEPGR